MTANVLRYAFFAVFGLGAAFMLATNVIAFKVLRPPKKLGFLWWHVTAISISFLCFGVVVMDRVFQRLASDPPVEADWRTYIIGMGILTFTIAQVIIFGVERGRLTQKAAVDLSTDNVDLIYDPVTQVSVPLPEPTEERDES